MQESFDMHSIYFVINKEHDDKEHGTDVRSCRRDVFMVSDKMHALVVFEGNLQ